MEENKNFSIFEAVFSVLIISTPLFYGTLLILPLSIFQLVSFALLALFLFKIFTTTSSRIIYPSCGIFILIFLICIAFQLVSLPVQFLKLISSKTFDIYQNYSSVSGQERFLSLSICSFPTKQELIKLLSFFSIFLIALNVIKGRKQFERLFLIIIIWAAMLSLYGVMKRYFLLDKEFSQSFSVFGNRNHFAGFMVIVAPLSLGYSLSCEDKFKRLIFLFLSALICAGIVLSLSRGGVISLVLAFILMAFILKKELIARKKYWAILLVVIGVVFLVFFVCLDVI